MGNKGAVATMQDELMARDSRDRVPQSYHLLYNHCHHPFHHHRPISHRGLIELLLHYDRIADKLD